MGEDKVPWLIRKSKAYSDPLLRDLIEKFYSQGEKWRIKRKKFQEIVTKIIGLHWREGTVGEIVISLGETKMLDEDMSLEEIEAEVKRSKHSRYPVLEKEKGEVMGILHVKDLITRAEIVKEKGWKSILRDALHVPYTMGLFVALKKMRDARSHLLIVVDPATEGIEGIITMEDILEEIVGDITDEFDYEREKKVYVLKKGKGEVIVRGDTPLRVLKERFGIMIDAEMEEEFDSVAGLVIAKNGYMVPDQGEKFRYAGWEFEVEKVNASKIEEVKLRPIKGSQDS